MALPNDIIIISRALLQMIILRLLSRSARVPHTVEKRRKGITKIPDANEEIIVL